jgi:hypothetical protein
MPTSYSLDGGRQPSGCVGRKGEQKTMLDGICRISQIMLSEICRLLHKLSQTFATLGFSKNILLLFYRNGRAQKCALLCSSGMNNTGKNWIGDCKFSLVAILSMDTLHVVIKVMLDTFLCLIPYAIRFSRHWHENCIHLTIKSPYVCKMVIAHNIYWSPVVTLTDAILITSSEN